MKEVLLSQLPRVTSGEWLSFKSDGPIKHFVTDSRNATPRAGSLFFAISGERHDGHVFLAELYEAGINNFIVQRKVSTIELPGANIYLVKNTIDALQDLAAHHREQFLSPIVAITGSNGKTIIKEWIGSVLESKFVVGKSPKSYNSQIGVPLSVWSLKPSVDIGIIEAGISQPGEMSKLETVIRPTVGIFTNLGSAHDRGFSSRAEKLEEKLQLFRSSEAIIFCADDDQVAERIRTKYHDRKLISWSLAGNDATYTLLKEGKTLLIQLGANSKAFRCDFADDPSIENLIFTIITGLYFDLTESEINNGIGLLKPVKMRLELKEGQNDTFLIDDSYNNDLNGLEVALQFMQQHRQYGKKTLIISSILQASEEDDVLYNNVNELARVYQIDRIVGIGEAICANQSVFTMAFEAFENVEAFLEDPPLFRQEIILIKGARKFGLERVVASLQQKLHGTRLEINLESVIHNLNYYRSLLQPGTQIMVMVKALGYGSGGKELAQVLEYQKVDYLGVAYPDEGVELRKSGITIPIMAMNCEPFTYPLLAQYDIEPEIYSIRQLRSWIDFVAGVEFPPAIHVKVDTGMKRLGFATEEIDGLAEMLVRGNLKVGGIFSHLASADDPESDQFTLQQFAMFERSYEAIVSAIGYQPVKHMLNSPGIIRFPRYQYEMVRLGIGLYGYEASRQRPEALKHVSVLKSTISQIKEVKAGQSVGYGRAWTSDVGTTIATVAIGYGDGYRRSFSNGVGKMCINGKLAPVVGSVCMDMTMVDVTGIQCAEGDEVVVFGEFPTIAELANWIGTIPYEILTNVSYRVQRLYTSE